MASKEMSSLLKTPLMGTWSIQGVGVEHPGILYLDDGQLRLKLFIEADDDAGGDPKHPTLEAIQPPKQPTCIGRTKVAGVVTLFHCAFLHISTTSNYEKNQSLVEVTLIPAQAWSGSDAVDNKGTYAEPRFDVPGLHNILSRNHVRHEYLQGKKLEIDKGSYFDQSPASEAYLVYYSDVVEANVVHENETFEVAFFTSVSRTHSSTTGVGISSSDRISIKAKGATLETLLNVKSQIEQFLSIVCVGRVISEEIELYEQGNWNPAKLLWRLGRSQDSKSVKRMPHEVLVSIGEHPNATGNALRTWFEADDQRKLARWLVCESLSAKTFSASRFLSLAQAWEIMGREIADNQEFDKDTLKKAAEAAAVALELYLGAEAAQRFKGLLEASNRPSFKTLVDACLAHVPDVAVKMICEDSTAFTQMVVKTRNALTHMRDKKSFSLDQASRTALFLTYKLSVLFCVLEAQLLGLPLNNLPSSLANNDIARVARRPIPV